MFEYFKVLLLAFEHVVDELAVHRIFDKFFLRDVSVPVTVHGISAQKIKSRLKNG